MRAKKALQYVMQTNPVNRAVLSTELAPELGYTYKQVEPLVDSLPDNLAKKWYLKGIIAANDPDMENATLADLVNKYGADVALKLQAIDCPDFLAYFQHSFDMNASYKKYYATEANVNDDLRKRYPYKEADIPVYRKRFKYITKSINDDEKQAEEAE